MVSTTTTGSRQSVVLSPFHLMLVAAGLSISISSASLMGTTPVQDNRTQIPPFLSKQEIPAPTFGDFSSYRGFIPVDQDNSASKAPVSIGLLRDLSGLTADQLGRIFGVSRRSIQSWLAGGQMASHHRQMLVRVVDTVLNIPANTNEARRALLLDSSKGQSIFHQLVSMNSKEILMASPLSVSEQLGL